jgi:hypothetical protein
MAQVSSLSPGINAFRIVLPDLNFLVPTPPSFLTIVLDFDILSYSVDITSTLLATLLLLHLPKLPLLI